MYWASHFSWAQGEERVRMLAHSLSRGLAFFAEGVQQEDTDKGLQESIAGFLRQTTVA
jgi:hypothetical protein